MKKVVFEGRGIKVGVWKDPIYSGIDVKYDKNIGYFVCSRTPGVQVVVKNVKGRDGRVYDMYRTFKREEYFEGHVFEYIDIYFKLARKEEN